MTTTKGRKCKPGQIVHWRPGTEEELVDIYISDGPYGTFALYQSLEAMRIWPIVKMEDGKYTYKYQQVQVHKGPADSSL